MEGACHSRTAKRKRPYIVAPYDVLESGEVEVELPSFAPCGEDGAACDIRKHAERRRKTGISHKLVILRCAHHGCCWTLYPPGFAPFLRRPITSARGWVNTLFLAAWAAAHGEVAWPRDQRLEGPARPCWRTQTRQIAAAALLLGLADGDDRPAQQLGVDIDDAHKAIAQFRSATGFRGRARAIKALLTKAEPHDIERNLRRAAHHRGVLGKAFEVFEGGLHPM